MDGDGRGRFVELEWPQPGGAFGGVSWGKQERAWGFNMMDVCMLLNCKNWDVTMMISSAQNLIIQIIFC